VKLFITGVSGLLGVNLAMQLRDDHQITGAYLSHPVSISGCQTMRLDLTSPEDVAKAIEATQPNVVINTVALTDVERCESDAPLAELLNQTTARNVALASSNIGAKFVHISTDQLFDGTSQWMTETDDLSPLNIYAKTKIQGENSVLEVCLDALIIRTNFFGWGTSLRASFSDWILRSLEERQTLNMLTDGYFTPILINDLINLIVEFVDAGASGTFNVCGVDRVSKYEFALELARTFDYSTELINPVSIDSFNFKATRPKEMSLRSSKAESVLNRPMPILAESLLRLKGLRKEKWPDILESAITGPTLLPDSAT